MYTPTDWTEQVALNAARLNNMETQYQSIIDYGEALKGDDSAKKQIEVVTTLPVAGNFGRMVLLKDFGLHYDDGTNWRLVTVLSGFALSDQGVFSFGGVTGMSTSWSTYTRTVTTLSRQGLIYASFAMAYEESQENDRHREMRILVNDTVMEGSLIETKNFMAITAGAVRVGAGDVVIGAQSRALSGAHSSSVENGMRGVGWAVWEEGV